MTESEWLGCESPELKLPRLSGLTSLRKARLFAVACCRRVWALFSTDEMRSWVKLAELWAEGQANAAACAIARQKAYDLSLQLMRGFAGPFDFTLEFEAASAILDALEDLQGPSFVVVRSGYDGVADLCQIAGKTEYMITLAKGGSQCETSSATETRPELEGHLHTMACIFGNPFRPIAVDHAWLRWNGGTVLLLAQLAYDERHLPGGELDKGRLAILADALEDAGCTNADILDHLRGPGPHVRGCWAVDLLLGKA